MRGTNRPRISRSWTWTAGRSARAGRWRWRARRRCGWGTRWWRSASRSASTRPPPTGIVSGLERNIQAPNGFQIDRVMQNRRADQPSESGGPLLDTRGRVVGVNSQIATAGARGSIGIGFAVPADAVRGVLPRLKAGERIERPFIGLTSSADPRGGGARPGRRQGRPGRPGRPERRRRRDRRHRRPPRAQPGRRVVRRLAAQAGRLRARDGPARQRPAHGSGAPDHAARAAAQQPVSFGAPWYLLALAAVPLAVVAYLLLDRRRRRAAAAFAAPATMPSVVTGRGQGWRRHAPMVVYALALIALALAFARPERTVAVPDGRAAVVLATDRSSSMRATDVRPSRIAAVRRAAKGFLDDVPAPGQGRQRGLQRPRHAASRARALRRGAVRESVDGLAAEGGTATGEAIAASLRSLERARGPKGKNPAAIILLSDGFSTSGRDPIEAARDGPAQGRARLHGLAGHARPGTIDIRAPRRHGVAPRGTARHRVAARDRPGHQGTRVPRRGRDQARGGLRPRSARRWAPARRSARSRPPSPAARCCCWGRAA